MNRLEQQIHKAVAAHLRQRGVPGLLWWHTAQGVKLGGRRNRKGVNIQGAIMNGLGVRAGVSDILALYQKRFYALELKAPGGRPTEEQLQFLADVRINGGYGVVAEGLNEALLCLEMWGLLRGSSVQRAAA